MDNILDFDTNHVALAFTKNRITTMWDLLGMSFNDIATLTYKDAAGNIVDIAKGDKGKLQCLKCFNNHIMDEENNPIIDDEWKKINPGEFNDYRIGMVYTSTQVNSTGTMAAATMIRSKSTHVHDAMSDFKKGI
jgi:hypothetical protein